MSAADDNRRRWDGRRRGHYEVWYLTGNDDAGDRGFWIRYTLEAPLGGSPYCQLWCACFDAQDPTRTFAINRIFPIDEHGAGDAPFAVSVGAATLGADRASGRLAGDGHEVAWDLAWTPSPRTLRQLPPLFYRRGGLGDTTVLTPNPDVRAAGWIDIDGQRVALRRAPFAQTHLWGRKHAHSWAWGHCNAFSDRPGAVLETLTARLARRGVVSPRLTVATLWLDGREHRFNRIRGLPWGRSAISTGRYDFAAQSRQLRIEGELRCHPDDMVMAHYHDPDGAEAFCANTEVADLQLAVYERRRGAWREREVLHAPRSGHFEIGQRQRDAAIGKDHVTI